MLIVRWLVVWEQALEDKTIVNIFPAAKHIQAPYPVNCKLTVISQEPKSTPPLTLEGSKVNQPSQLVLEEVFPFQDASVKIRGVLIELIPTRWSLDLSLSRCLVERINKDRVLHYSPTNLPMISKPNRHEKLKTNHDLNFSRLPTLPIIKNSSTVTSVVTINNSENVIGVNFGLKGLEAKSSQKYTSDEGEIMDQKLTVNSPPYSCFETPLITKQTKSAISLAKVESDELAVYIFERNSETSEIESIATIS
jgi:hypothetical protein